MFRVFFFPDPCDIFYLILKNLVLWSKSETIGYVCKSSKLESD
jgi:hypothetical protein